MDITLKCKISLSKKLRALMGQSGTISLTVNQIVDGRGEGSLFISGESVKEMLSLSDDLKNETSIMLTPVDLVDNVPNMGSLMHGSIFSTDTKDDKNPIIRKLAVITPPERGEEGKAFKDNVPTPKAFKELDDPKCKAWISNMTELIEVANAAKSKRSTIDPSTAQNDRERAVMMEMRDREEAMDTPAWIVNDTTGHMMVNDLNISLELNVPYDLSNISAKKVASSRDLRGLINGNYVRFISPEEVESYAGGEAVEEEEEGHGLKVFSRHEDAEADIADGGDYADEEPVRTSSRRPQPRPQPREREVIQIEEIDDSNIDEPTEDESMLINLTQNLPKIKTIHSSPSNSTTVHGNRPAAPKSNSVKTIRKIER